MYRAQATLCISKLKALSPTAKLHRPQLKNWSHGSLQGHLALGLVLLKGTQSISLVENKLIRRKEKSCSYWIKPFPKLPKTIFVVFFFKFYFIFKLYIIVFVLPNIKMNPPQVYMCSPSWTLLPPPSPFLPSGLSQCTSPKHPVSCNEPGLATRFIHDILHVSMPFSQIFPPSPSLSESIRLFVMTVILDAS